MTVQLFERRAVLVVGQAPPDNFVQVVPDALKIEGLRIQFKIERDDQPKPNRSSIAVYNLSDASRAKLQDKGVRIVLSAGYGGQVAQIFSGEARDISHDKTGTEWVSKFESGDSERTFQWARATGSFGAGVTKKDVVATVVRSMQVDPGNMAKAMQAVGTQFTTGYAMHARASTELTRLLEPEGLTWSVQDGRLQILSEFGTVPDAGTPLLSPSTGLVGVPTMGAPEKKGGPAVLKVRSLLRPEIRPGTRFLLNSSGRSGFYKAKKVVHDGDTDGGNFYTDVEAIQVT